MFLFFIAQVVFLYDNIVLIGEHWRDR